MKTQKNEEMYYIRCLTEAGTIIGKRHYNPQVAPVEIPKSEYERFRGEYDFYDEKGTINIEKPGGQDFAVVARQAKIAQKLAAEDDLIGELPPASIEIPAFGTPLAVREQMAKSKMRAAKADPDYCQAKRADGLQCRSKPRKDRTICGFHAKMVADGREVKDMTGRLFTLEDIE